jgi:exopolysaccharide production protein ExoQ
MRRRIGTAELGEFGARGVALAGLFFMTGSLVVTLTPSGADASAKVQVLGAFFGLWGGLGLLIRPGALNRILMLYWPVVLAPALAVASLLWTVDPALSLRRSGALVLTTVFAIWLVERFPRRVLFGLIISALIVTVYASLAMVFLEPSVGVHQAFDDMGQEAAHAGDWRGLYFHKNDFGRMMALCFSILCVGIVTRPRWRWACLPTAAAAVMGVAGSGSGQAAFLSALLPVVIATAVLLRRASARGRAMVVVFVVPLAVLFMLLWQLAFATVLELLGKDPTLTGRTEIWGGVLSALRGNLLIGGGFGAGWDIVGDRLYALTAISVGHAHNGYLDLMTDLGVVGLILVLTLMLGLLLSSARAFMSGRAPAAGLLGLTVAVFSIVGNWAASFLLLHNSLYWVLPAVLIAQSRQIFCPWGHVARPRLPVLQLEHPVPFSYRATASSRLSPGASGLSSAAGGHE